MLLTVEKYFLWFIAYSFLGWLYESAYCSIKERKWINRGFLNGPLCPLYGTGAILVILILGNVKNTVSLFLSSAVLTCTLEYITSYVMEKLFAARWWDYSDSRFNLNGRVCLAGALAFGSFSVLLIKFLHPFVVRITDLIPTFMYHITILIYIVIFSVDIAVTISGMAGFEEKLREAEAFIHKKRYTSEKHRERLAASFSSVREALRDKLSYQQIRMIESFPRLKSIRHDGALKEIREFMEKVKKQKNK